MTDPQPGADPAKLTVVARDLAAAMDDLGISGVFIGGFAVSALIRPRFTQDIDAMILSRERAVEEVYDAFSRHGFRPRYDDHLQFAHAYRMVLLHHIATGVPADVSLGILKFEELAVERAIAHRIDGVVLRLAAPEDLVVMKGIAWRSRDRDDIEAIVRTVTDLDVDRIERELTELALEMEIPEIVEQVMTFIRNVRAEA